MGVNGVRVMSPSEEAVRRFLSSKRSALSAADLLQQRTVGTGTFGRVRLVKLAKGPNVPLALKTLRKSKILQMKQLEHVLNEVKILGSIQHPFIVNLMTSFQDSTRLYMLMEFVNGGELFAHLRKQVRLTTADARFYAAEIVLAFEYLHSLDIVYRDLKPENLLIDVEGHLKLTDFGFAKVVEDRTWTLCGTPEYLAPEIIQSKGHGKSVDWWALGILIFEMLVGTPPFYDEDPMNIYKKVIEGYVAYPDFMDVRAKDLIRKLLVYDRTKRFGCLKNGAADIRRHRFFKSTDWQDCLYKQLDPPYIPAISDPYDTSCFDEYSETDDQETRSLTKQEQLLFQDF